MQRAKLHGCGYAESKITRIQEFRERDPEQQENRFVTMGAETTPNKQVSQGDQND